MLNFYIYETFNAYHTSDFNYYYFSKDIVSTFLLVFLVSFFGLVKNQNTLLKSLIFLELIFLCFSVFFISFSTLMGDFFGQIVSIFIIVLSVAELVFGLSVFVLAYNLSRNFSYITYKNSKN